jgi:hypothetical protein
MKTPKTQKPSARRACCKEFGCGGPQPLIPNTHHALGVRPTDRRTILVKPQITGKWTGSKTTL